MNDNLESRIEALEKNMDQVIRMLGIKKTQQAMAPYKVETKEAATTTPSTPYNVVASETGKTTEAGQWLGYAGVSCLVLACIFLIRLSIDSGWLTPERQLIISSFFGMSLIFLPFTNLLKDREYISQLPAAGISILHLTVYGAVFYHQLISHDLAVLLMSTIGVLSIGLLAKFKFDIYAVISIVGTYVGALLLKQGFSSHAIFGLFLMAWNIAYCLIAISLQRRSMILLASYLAIGLVSLKALQISPDPAEYMKIASMQALQFLTFLTATVTYSQLNRVTLTQTEAWNYFPLAIFFYGLEYHLFNYIDKDYATFFALGFSVVLLIAYKFAKSLRQESVESARVVYTLIATILSHAVYFVLLSDELRILSGLFLALIFFTQRQLLFTEERFKGLLVVLFAMFGFSQIQLLVGDPKMDINFLILMGFIFGSIFALASKYLTKSNTGGLGNFESLSLAAANAQVLFATYRLKQYIDHSWVAPLWIVYAFILLLWGWRTSERAKAQSALPVVVLALLRFIVVDFSHLNAATSVLALFIMGGLIFASGYIYKKIPT